MEIASEWLKSVTERVFGEDEQILIIGATVTIFYTVFDFVRGIKERSDVRKLEEERKILLYIAANFRTSEFYRYKPYVIYRRSHRSPMDRLFERYLKNSLALELKFSGKKFLIRNPIIALARTILLLSGIFIALIYLIGTILIGVGVFTGSSEMYGFGEPSLGGALSFIAVSLGFLAALIFLLSILDKVGMSSPVKQEFKKTVRHVATTESISRKIMTFLQINLVSENEKRDYIRNYVHYYFQFINGVK
ncbi:hypothetical protein [Corynebacterium pseudodiphtheriticum]|uniref:hypothetical protein n=1 Tax=Corynebacterium pseudodiphtheriticum TaxID=37637 RepID=UPI0025428C63|nr:hypothetical protein [Corynebacterium pseudodiphtheriticum]MDK4237637.1 hypothetical protein [Corynebacterium pseudodiphtheriticum]MDK4285017.1 hypothetical protein [Corynebacterium pseudodiphtheriticum]MDK4328756.1 hypothetical protein [Corynebacterium pseudodiphtheriticum]MDK8396583.1 hypothetical protein [Corynebacterium pseudodiphtheriticum]